MWHPPEAWQVRQVRQVLVSVLRTSMYTPWFRDPHGTSKPLAKVGSLRLPWSNESNAIRFQCHLSRVPRVDRHQWRSGERTTGFSGHPDNFACIAPAFSAASWQHIPFGTKQMQGTHALSMTFGPLPVSPAFVRTASCDIGGGSCSRKTTRSAGVLMAQSRKELAFVPPACPRPSLWGQKTHPKPLTKPS